MLKVNFEYKEAKAVIKDGKPVIEYDTSTSNYLVASTKSYNNLVDDLRLTGKIATKTNVSELFLDKAQTEKAILDLVSNQLKPKGETDETIKAVVLHAMQSLDGAVIFKRPPIKRK